MDDLLDLYPTKYMAIHLSCFGWNIYTKLVFSNYAMLTTSKQEMSCGGIRSLLGLTRTDGTIWMACQTKYELIFAIQENPTKLVSASVHLKKMLFFVQNDAMKDENFCSQWLV